MHARDALLDALLPQPAPWAPAPHGPDRATFWVRFDAVAPLHLRAALALAAWVVVGALPVAIRCRSWASLDANGRDELLQQVATWPVVQDLLEVAKLVACLAYFDAELTQDAFRASTP